MHAASAVHDGRARGGGGVGDLPGAVGREGEGEGGGEEGKEEKDEAKDIHCD